MSSPTSDAGQTPLQSVFDALNGCVDGGTLRVPDDFLGSVAIKLCWDTFFAGKSLDVAGVNIALNEGDVTVTGTGQGLFDQLTVTAKFTAVAGDLGVEISGAAAAGWSLTNAFPALASTFFASLPVDAGGTLTLKTGAAGGGSASGSLAFAGSLNVAQFSADLASITGNSIAFTGTIAVAGGAPSFDLKTADATWTLPIGSGLTVSKALVELGYAGAPSAKVSGTLVLDASTSLAFDWTLPAALHIVGNFTGSSLLKLAADLRTATVALPPSFDVPLPACTISISKDGGTYAFDVAADVESIGQAMFTAQKAPAGGWGFGFGVDLSVAKLADLAGLTALSALENVIALQNLLLAVGSNIDASTTFPDAAQFSAATFPVQGITLPEQAGGMQPGLNAYADIDLSKNAVTQPLATLLNLSGTAGAAISIPPDPANGTSLTVSVTGTVDGVTIAGALGVALQNGIPQLTLNGSATTSIQSQPVTFTVAAVFMPNGVFIAGTMQGRVAFSPVTLSNLALVVGIAAEGIPSVGVAGQIDVQDFESSIAIFFDSVTPTQSMFAGSIGNVDLGTVVATFAGELSAPIPPAVQSVLSSITLSGTGAFSLPAAPLATALADGDAKAVSEAFAAATPPVTLPASLAKMFISQGATAGHWFVTDLASVPPTHYELTQSGSTFAVTRNAQIYVVPQKTQIGELSFDAGTALNGTLSVLGVTATAEVRIFQSTGISASASLTKIVLPNENVLVISSVDGTAGPSFSLSTFADASQTDPKLQGPHVYITGKVSLLGLLGESVAMDLQSDGFHCTLSRTNPGGTMTLAVTLTSASGFLASGSASIAINQSVDLGSVAGQNLGTVTLDTIVTCTLAVSGNSTQASAGFTGWFRFQNQRFTIPTVQLDVSTASLTNFAGTVLGAAQAAIAGFVRGDVNLWLNWVNANVIPGVKSAPAQVGAVLSNAYYQSPAEIASLARNALGYGVDAAAAALRAAGDTANDAANVLSSAGYAAGDITNAIASAFSGIHADVGVGHIDTTPGGHVDMHVPPHGDTSIWGRHVDTPAGPHVDSHIDTSTHVDTGR